MKLTRLNCDGVGEADGALHHFGDGDVLPMFDVASEHIRLQPWGAPRVFDGNDSVGSGNHPTERETSVEIGLISAKEFLMHLRIFRNEYHHDAGRALISALCKTFYGSDAFGQE